MKSNRCVCGSKKAKDVELCGKCTSRIIPTANDKLTLEKMREVKEKSLSMEGVVILEAAERPIEIIATKSKAERKPKKKRKVSK